MPSHPIFMLGVDIGGTQLRLAITDNPGHVICRRVLPSPAQEAPAIMVEAIVQTAKDLLEDVGGTSLAAVGVAAPGPIDVSNSEVLNAPNLPKFRRTPLKALLERELEAPVVLENDANAAAVAEQRLGHGRNVENMVYITVSTGIGGGIIIDGRLYHGFRGGAGEFGHMTIDPKGPLCGCGKRGCWEAFASGTAIAHEAARRLLSHDQSPSRLADGKGDSLDARMVCEAALAGDRLSQEILNFSAFYFGVGLANVVNVFSPELVVVGGGLTNAGELFISPAFKTCRAWTFPFHADNVRLEVTYLGDDIALLGALELAGDLL
jgi:glucokinase